MVIHSDILSDVPSLEGRSGAADVQIGEHLRKLGFNTKSADAKRRDEQQA